MPMAAIFEKAMNNTLYQDVVAQICEMILAGSIRKGELLPSESKLCTQFQVSRRGRSYRPFGERGRL